MTEKMLDHAYGSTKWPRPSTTNMKYFWASVKQRRSTGLFGFASMFWTNSATKIEKKAESSSKKLLLVAGVFSPVSDSDGDMTAANRRQIR